MAKAQVKTKQRGTPAEHLKYMLKSGLRYAPPEGIAAAAEALIPYLSAGQCHMPYDDCRPGACNCDGTHDALAYALTKFRNDDSAWPESLSTESEEVAKRLDAVSPELGEGFREGVRQAEDRGQIVAVKDGKPGCPATVWDGAQSIRCSKGVVQCGRHGPFDTRRGFPAESEEARGCTCGGRMDPPMPGPRDPNCPVHSRCPSCGSLDRDIYCDGCEPFIPGRFDPWHSRPREETE